MAEGAAGDAPGPRPEPRCLPGRHRSRLQPTGDILAIDRIRQINARIPNTHLEMHGSSSVPADLLESSASTGQMKETCGVLVSEIQEVKIHPQPLASLAQRCARGELAQRVRVAARARP